MGLKQLGAILPLFFNFVLVSCAQGESFVLLEKRSPMPFPLPLELQALDNGPTPKEPHVFVSDNSNREEGQPGKSSAQVFYASSLSPVPASKRSLNARAGTCPSGFHACDASIAEGCCENNKYCMVATDGTPGCCLIGKTCTSVSGCPNGFVKCPNTEGCCKIGTTCSGNTCIPGNSGGTGTCNPGYFACPQSQGGGCCKTGYTCVGSDKCQPPTSTNSCDTGKFECPASVGGGCCPIGTTCTADKCIKPCPSGYFRCSASLGGGCCKDGYTCNSDETCSSSNGGNNGGNNGGVCSAGMYACAESEGGGCCSTGYVCTLNKCSRTVSGGASAFTPPGVDPTTSVPVLTRTATTIRYSSVTSTSKRTSKTPTATPTDIPGSSTGGSGRNAVNYGPLVLFFAVAGMLL